MQYGIVSHGPSVSFPDGDPFLAGKSDDPDIIVHLGGGFEPHPDKTAVIVEVDTDFLGVHTGEEEGKEGSNVVGFARFIGPSGPSALIELVRQPLTKTSALDAARAVFEAAGLTVVVSADQPGRIIDRLIRPKYNAALRFLDEGLASAEAMDLTCRLGLGYAKGPIEAVTGSGLARHHDISRAIFDVTGQPGYAPARRSSVAKARENL
ncbi:MAG: 3-hydroxyacyl-CoA dehydrogenase family protein [Pseudomonadota bacterium]